MDNSSTEGAVGDISFSYLLILTKGREMSFLGPPYMCQGWEAQSWVSHEANVVPVSLYEEQLIHTQIPRVWGVQQRCHSMAFTWHGPSSLALMNKSPPSWPMVQPVCCLPHHCIYPIPTPLPLLACAAFTQMGMHDCRPTKKRIRQSKQQAVPRPLPRPTRSRPLPRRFHRRRGWTCFSVGWQWVGPSYPLLPTSTSAARPLTTTVQPQQSMVPRCTASTITPRPTPSTGSVTTPNDRHVATSLVSLPGSDSVACLERPGTPSSCGRCAILWAFGLLLGGKGVALS